MTGTELKRKKANEKKRRQRERIKKWCEKHYGVSCAESVVMILMREEKAKR